MTTYAREEIMSSSEVVRNFSSVLASISGHKREKVAIIRNNRMEAVLVPIDEYERMQEICEVAEQFELYGIVNDRSKTPSEQYVSLADTLKRSAEERAFMKAVLQGFADIEEGRTASLADAKKRLGLV